MTDCAELELINQFYPSAESARILQYFLRQHDWPDNCYHFAGRQFVLPRLQTWHADAGIRYSYSNNLLETRPWTEMLSQIRIKVESLLDYSFNSVLVNCYRNGDDHVGWHADNERELGENPFIASVSFGAERAFAFKHKRSSEQGRILLGSGCLLIMRPAFQTHWLHSVPEDKTSRQARINLTFRRVNGLQI
ncbi:alpha-ketoglutarate-dependent dioxygenase AlkB [Methylomonas sp. LL1]|uniref:alpha-ketoglutarate-dependent dioxygenase AlkB family protein n=1 Tax=Methylomonas sp. LL1 TaxID=2785785 RepID=UPI0018C37EEC|nr:alpha-ketoglutarate-dependent dioxygenase AlkB [Methylomonas sp. LL1]QPK63609.1 alpha-ketoglutarate-dependent dioxygenase AlkB [Methylomonas sp. LL1]